MVQTRYTKKSLPDKKPVPLWQAAGFFFYGLGCFFTLCTLSLTGWVAWCVATESEPMAALAFLPPLPHAAIFAAILGSLVLCCAFWQFGALCHQKSIK